MFYETSSQFDRTGCVITYTVFDGERWRRNHNITIDSSKRQGYIAADEVISIDVGTHTFLTSHRENAPDKCIYARQTPYMSKNSWYFTPRIHGTDIICFNRTIDGINKPYIELVNLTNSSYHVVDVPQSMIFGLVLPIGIGRMFIPDVCDMSVDPLITCYKCSNTDDARHNWYGAIGHNTIYAVNDITGLIKMRDIRVDEPQIFGKMWGIMRDITFLQSGCIVGQKSDQISLCDLRMPCDMYDLPDNDSKSRGHVWKRFVDIES